MPTSTPSPTDDAVTAAKILRGLRERVSRLEKRDQYALDRAHLLRTTSDTAHVEGTTTLKIVGSLPPAGFGATPFGENFGDTAPVTGDDDEPIIRTVANTTTDGYHRFLAAATIPTLDNSPQELPDPPDQLAVGDGTGEFTKANTDLHDRLGAVPLTDAQVDIDGTTAVLRAYLSTGDFNGETLREIGLVNESEDRLFNHARISPPIEKTSAIELTVECHLSLVDEGPTA